MARPEHDIIDDPTADLPILIALWRAHDSDRWSKDPILYQRLGQRFLKFGEALVAYDVLAEGLEYHPGDIRQRQLMALALARSGAPEPAEALIKDLAQKDLIDEETLGIKARIHKDLWQEAARPEMRQRQLRQAYEAYLEAYRVTGGYWTGINAATMALFLGEREQAESVARRVRTQCLAELDRAVSPEDKYWPLATLGEAALVIGEWDEAEQRYAQAAEAGRGRWGDISSTRRNLRLLLRHLGIEGSTFENRLRIPPVVVFAGHMMDRPRRPVPRFPALLERPVFEAIKARLETLNTTIGYSSAACGSDILFLEALVERQGEAHIILPYNSEEFRRDSVDIIPESSWGRRFSHMCQLAAEVVVASEYQLRGSAVSFEYANRLLLGLSAIRAEQLETELVVLAVWNGQPGDGPGGTQGMIETGRQAVARIELIHLQEMMKAHCPQLLTDTPTRVEDEGLRGEGEKGEFDPEIRAILFADVVDFSKYSEDEIPNFIRHFLGKVSRLVEGTPYPPTIKNTWGDGLYFAFHDIQDAGLFALDLRDLVRDTRWEEYGLRENLALRIGIHVGPVYQCMDPVTGRLTYIGSHVSRTSRIEPVTPPGKVYCSQAFAALASAGQKTGFKCEYVGQMPLAKGFGTFPTYHVRRRVR